MVAMVDDEDYIALSKFKWHAHSCNGNYYASRHSNEKIEPLRPLCIYMHRQILGISGCILTGDHVDGNTLNNQRNNLRPCTRSENMQNNSGYRKSTSKYVGISLCPEAYRKKRWVAHICTNRKVTYIGRFLYEIDAAIARDEYILDNNLHYYKLNVLTRDDKL